MVQTRRRAQRAAVTPTTATDTPASTVSPLFSNENSVQPETPDTSVVADEEPPVKATRQSRKRPAPETEEEEAEDIKTTSRRTSQRKKRVVTRQSFYIEVPNKTQASSARSKCTGKQPVTAVPKTKGKGKAAPEVKEDDDVEYMSESELEYDESADSGSAFEASEDEGSEGHDSEEDEALILQATIELSNQTARRDAQERAGMGSSSKVVSVPSAAVTVRAARAERRLAKGRKNKRKVYDSDEDDFEILEEDISELSALESSDEEEEPLSKGKGKGKGKKKTSKFARNLLDPNSAERHRSHRKVLQAEKNEMYRIYGRRPTVAQRNEYYLRKNHPELRDVWGDLEATIPVIVPEPAEQPAGLKVTLLPFQLESLTWMRKQETGPWHGGMLADEMGMGKTIQMISLFVSDLKRPNLVVAPTVALMQWRNEIAAHTEGMNVLVWYGSTRMTDPKELKKYDVVLTTYAVLESVFRKQQSGFKRKGMIVKERSPLHSMKWNRIILDEAHNIKERATNTAKATFELDSNYKWCLSGTPLQNRVGELYSLIRFLGGDPFSYYFCKRCDCKSLHWKFSDRKNCDECGHSPMQHTCFWNNEILTPIQKNGLAGPGRHAFKKLRVLLDRVMLRRTKVQRADDLGLPPRIVVVKRDYFSPEEKELYLSLFSDATRQFSTYVDSGTVLNNYSNIFSLITRMRQMACHPDLVLRSKTNGAKFLAADEPGEATVCRLCNDVAEDAIQAKCRHIFDRECIRQYLEAAAEISPDCPVCHVPLTIDLEAPALELDAEVQTSTRQGILGRLDLDKWRSSTKIEALVEELSNLRLQDHTTKSIVFSQFVNFLDLISFRLQKAGFKICRLEGTMSPQARDATIQHFMNNTEVTVFLVSLKAGGVALNLTEASRIYLMDSWWNPAVEFQAMDRIHRLGQHRPVKAYKLVVEDSIESRIIQLQEKKSAMVDATLSTDDSAMGRLTPEDLGFLFRL